MLHSALPCCRFMCTPHWQLFYLGVSTVLGGQDSGPQLSHTSLCCSLSLCCSTSSTCLAHLGLCAWLTGQLSCNTSHLQCWAKVGVRSCSASDVSVVNPTCEGLPVPSHQCLACTLTLLVPP